MKQIQSQLNHQLIGRIPNQMSSSYRKINGFIIAFQNLLQITKDQEKYDLKILSPGFMKGNKQIQMFNWQVNFTASELQKFTYEEFQDIYQYNCFLLGDLYKANSLAYIQQKYRTLDSYFEQDLENRNNLLLLGENMKYFNNFKLQNTEQNGFEGFRKIYVNKKNPYVTFSVYDVISANDTSLIFFQKLVEQGAFEKIEDALSYYGVTMEEIQQFNVHDLFQYSKLIPGNVQSYRNNYQDFYSNIAFCAYALHINQFHRNVPGNAFSQNLCEQCNSFDSEQHCTSLKPISPLKQPQLVPLNLLQQYPLDYKYYDIICILYHSLICQFKIWSFQDSVESILNYEITDEAIMTSQSNSIRNYENLELLGDSVLKYVVTAEIFDNYENLDEGEMTSLRSRLIMNTFLADLFEQCGLDHYIINQDLHFKQIRNPLINEIKSSESLNLQMSQKADIFEAIIGGVFEKSQNLYEYLTVLRRAKFPISIQKNKLFDFEPIDEYQNHTLTVQEYQFQNSQLLEIALNPNQYDRLEFLGDAALELLAVAYLFKIARKHQKQNKNFILNPGNLSNWKQELLGNKFMGEQIIKMGILPKVEEIPKSYGDVFESIAAAILLDGGWKNLNKVFGSIYKKEIENKFL